MFASVLHLGGGRPLKRGTDWQWGSLYLFGGGGGGGDGEQVGRNRDRVGGRGQRGGGWYAGW